MFWKPDLTWHLQLTALWLASKSFKKILKHTAAHAFGLENIGQLLQNFSYFFLHFCVDQKHDNQKNQRFDVFHLFLLCQFSHATFYTMHFYPRYFTAQDVEGIARPNKMSS